MLSPLVAEHVQRPRNEGPIPGGTYGVAGHPGDGPYVEMWLDVRDGRVLRAGYQTHGCPSSIGATSVLCTLLLASPQPQIVAEMSTAEFLLILGGLPEGKEFCADLALAAARSALAQARPGETIS